MGHHLIKLALGPILLLQGRAVRRSTPVLPEPPGDRRGVKGNGPPLKLLVMGDSSAAGIGAPHQHQALLGRLVGNLMRSHRVEWTLQAGSGATTALILRNLRELEGAHYDVVVTSLGLNDVTSGVGKTLWLDQQAELRRILKNDFKAKLIIVSGLPPVHGFPVLPQPLRWYLGRIATQFDSELQESVSKDKDTVFLSLRFTENAALMASDGFHPGPEIYTQWAERAAAIVHGRADV
jgi:lysophospholipase L1-like esterase